jgi:S-methylmethionine-dependent homocysteine/selenocysteine methylase
MSLDTLLARPAPVFLDGATGTELGRHGIDTRLPLWSARALDDARGRAVLVGIHAAYARAGAEILTTCTFRTTRRSLAAAGRGSRWRLFNQYAVDAARAGARASHPAALVAGSIAPLEDCYRPDLVPPQADAVREHLVQVDLLARLGVDLVLVETMNSAREALAAIRAVRAAGIDALVSLCPGPPDALLSGEPLARVVPRLLDAGGARIRGLLLNCATPEVLGRAAPLMKTLAAGLPWGMYAHLGEPDPVQGWRLPEGHDPEGYAEWAAGIATGGARLLGGCCGTTPDHVAALRRRCAPGRAL